jgi:hypothetical protein
MSSLQLKAVPAGGADPIANLLDVGRAIPGEKISKNIKAWRHQYAANSPFPHIALEDFFDPDIH